MSASSHHASETKSDLIDIEGVVTGVPTIGEMPGGRKFASCTLRTSASIGNGPDRDNSTWAVAVHRGPAVELMKAAREGDILRMRCIIQGGQMIVPRSDGRIDLLLTD